MAHARYKTATVKKERSTVLAPKPPSASSLPPSLSPSFAFPSLQPPARPHHTHTHTHTPRGCMCSHCARPPPSDRRFPPGARWQMESLRRQVVLLKEELAKLRDEQANPMLDDSELTHSAEVRHRAAVLAPGPASCSGARLTLLSLCHTPPHTHPPWPRRCSVQKSSRDAHGRPWSAHCSAKQN